jgi:flagellar hook-associated protein 3
MRITDNTVVSDFLSSLTRSRQRINRLNTQLVTKTKLQRLSDDPIAGNTLLRLDSDLTRIGSYKTNVTDGTSALKMTSDTLGKVSDVLQQVKGLLAGALNSDPSLLTKLSDQMDQYVNLSMDMANTQFDRKYIFGGTNTMSPPFVKSGAPLQVGYNGNASSIKYQVGDGMTSVVNISGAAAFTSTGEVKLAGMLDRSAPVNTTVTTTVSLTDASGVAHAVEMSMQKTGGNTWSLSAAMPAGSSDATISGGSATLTFDPTTGALASIVRGGPLVLTPNAVAPAEAAPPLTVMMRSTGVSEGTPPGGVSTVTGTHSSVSVFNKLMEMRDALRAGEMPSADDVAMVSMMQDVVMRQQARAGTLAVNLSTSDSFLTAQKEHLLDLRSAKQDVDLAEIGMKLKQEQVFYDAALSAASQIIPRSLMDYLK